jgi:GTPase
MIDLPQYDEPRDEPLHEAGEEREAPFFPPEEEAVDDEHRDASRLHDTAPRPERVILVGISRPPAQYRSETDEHLEELELLADTAGAEVVEKVYQNRSSIEVATFIGKGKAEYVRDRCEEADVQSVIFDDDLTPVQQRNLERLLNRKVVDRTALILDIFARHARTNAARTQVELAQLEYLLPRLTRLWTHLSKQYGGISTKGPGETQIETDRRLVRDRISRLKDKLERIDRQRATQRKGRDDVTRVALVGYTNAGKSTLLNILTGADVLVEDKLFATLDATVRALQLGPNTVLISDTVGFIRKLPAKLVASFRSTLAEVVEADMLLHVVDVSHPVFREHVQVVQQTIADLQAGDKPVLMVFNKIDRIENPSSLAALQEQYPESLCISAARGINIRELMEHVQRMVEARFLRRRFLIRPPDYRILAELHRESVVYHEEYLDDAIAVECRIEPDAAARLLKQHAAVLTVDGG